MTRMLRTIFNRLLVVPMQAHVVTRGLHRLRWTGFCLSLNAAASLAASSTMAAFMAFSSHEAHILAATHAVVVEGQQMFPLTVNLSRSSDKDDDQQATQITTAQLLLSQIGTLATQLCTARGSSFDDSSGFTLRGIPMQMVHESQFSGRYVKVLSTPAPELHERLMQFCVAN